MWYVWHLWIEAVRIATVWTPYIVRSHSWYLCICPVRWQCGALSVSANMAGVGLLTQCSCWTSWATGNHFCYQGTGLSLHTNPAPFSVSSAVISSLISLGKYHFQLTYSVDLTPPLWCARLSTSSHETSSCSCSAPLQRVQLFVSDCMLRIGITHATAYRRQPRVLI